VLILQLAQSTGSAVPQNGSDQIPVFLLQLKKDGFADCTIYSYGRDLVRMAKNTDLLNPEGVKEWIASQKLTNTRKWSLCKEYGKFTEFYQIPFKKPKYKVESPIPFFPTEKEVRSIIDATENLREKTALQLLYETGVRYGECSRLREQDFDFERSTVRIVAEKGSNNRELKISQKLGGMIQQIAARSPLNEPLFPTRNAAMLMLWKLRKRLAKEQNNPRFHQIHLHTFRHYRACVYLAQTNGNIMKVKNLLGHKSVTSTEIYARVVAFDDSTVNQYEVKEVSTKEDKIALTVAGWEFVMYDPKEQTYLFRKKSNLV
jgi:integrase